MDTFLSEQDYHQNQNWKCPTAVQYQAITNTNVGLYSIIFIHKVIYKYGLSVLPFYVTIKLYGTSYEIPSFQLLTLHLPEGRC